MERVYYQSSSIDSFYFGSANISLIQTIIDGKTNTGKKLMTDHPSKPDTCVLPFHRQMGTVNNPKHWDRLAWSEQTV